jgi:hypothetical protein
MMVVIIVDLVGRKVNGGFWKGGLFCCGEDAVHARLVEQVQSTQAAD